MVSANVCKKLADTGHEVHIFTRHTDMEMDRIHVHQIKSKYIFSPLKLIAFNNKVNIKLRNENFDLVYSLCHVYPVDIYRVGDGIHKHWMRIQYPNIIIRMLKYLISPVHLTMNYLESHIFMPSNCKFFIANSTLVKNQITEYFHIADEKIKVIYNGVNHAVFNPDVKTFRKSLRENLDIKTDEFVLLFISNNWERKGLSTIIRSIPETGINKIRLVIVGRGKKTRYRSLARHLKINSDRLIFTGHKKNICEYYSLADVFILPSRYEPFSNVCLEAMACGLPVITTKTNGASELIRTGENGFILNDWQDYKSLSETIKRLSDSSISKLISSNAVETAKEYTWERHIDEINCVFDKFIKLDLQK